MDEAEERYYIKDELGRVPCNDIRYINKGREEGWLVYRGCHRDHRNVVCHTYEIKDY